MLVIIDYGIGNMLSVKNMLRKAGVTDVLITADEEKIASATKILLPGVGHFDHGMRKLRQSGCIDVLNDRVLKDKVPILGICLGAQMLTNGSEEGIEPGLGWIDAHTLKFEVDKSEPRLPIPHMGWNTLDHDGAHPIFSGLDTQARFYFVHSYYMKPRQEENTLCTATYGHPFAAGIVKDNIIGVQFHPEKSHRFGLRFLENFVRI